MPIVVAYPFTYRNGSHQQLCVISLSYIFYVFQHWNLLEKGFFCRCFHRSEGTLQNNFLQIKVEEDLKFLLAQILLKYSKKQRKIAVAPWVFVQWARVDHPPLLLILFQAEETNDSHLSLSLVSTKSICTVLCENLSTGYNSTVLYMDEHSHRSRWLFDWAILIS